MELRDIVLFGLGTLFFLGVSRHALRNPMAHGFYRFFAWECMLALVVLNYRHWHSNLLSPPQIVSWLLLALSLALAIHSVLRLTRQGGNAGQQRADAALLHFEKTSHLVTDGVYRYIRHPMYAALLYLAWGIYLKNITGPTTTLVLLASGFLWMTALRDEAECQAYFGQAYRDYMRRSKRFVPFLL